MLVFGSFTEDEIKSLRNQPIENDIDITFGSLDSATLRSVGIFSTRPTDIETSSSVPSSKLVNRKNTDKAGCTAENTSVILGSVHGNGSIHDSCPCQFSDDVKVSGRNNVELPVPCVSEYTSVPLNPYGWNRHGTEVATLSSKPPENDILIGSSEIVGLASKPNLFNASNGLDAKVTTLLPRGLVNLGNLCFLNATLQALLSCSPFVELLQELRTRNIPQVGYPTLRAFVEFISNFDMPPNTSSKKNDVLETGRPFRPVMFESVLNNFSPDMPNSFPGRPRQEDAQEFLSFVMHQMHDELLKLEGQIPNGNEGKVSLVSSVSDEDEDNWVTVGPKNKTAITRTQSFIPSRLSAIFGGQVRSVVKARGNKASATIQPFLLLHLNIFPEPVCTIEDALHLFSAPETLEGYRASAAGKAELVSASKSVKIMELPKIIILHLMRFTYGSQGSTKLLKPVHFPLELVLGREMLVSPSSESRKYELVATITHHGSEPSKGHYTADILPSSGKWLRYDDASVVAIPTSKVLHDQAYVLFYKQL